MTESELDTHRRIVIRAIHNMNNNINIPEQKDKMRQYIVTLRAAKDNETPEWKDKIEKYISIIRKIYSI